MVWLNVALDSFAYKQVDIHVTSDLAEHSRPRSRREELSFENGKNGGWRNERQVPAGGLGDSDSWQLQVSSDTSLAPFHTLPHSCLHAAQPHVDGCPPTPAAGHGATRPGC